MAGNDESGAANATAPLFCIVCPLDDNKVPGHPPDASELLPVKKTVKKYNIFDQ
jgi:hypothetical protein